MHFLLKLSLPQISTETLFVLQTNLVRCLNAQVSRWRAISTCRDKLSTRKKSCVSNACSCKASSPNPCFVTPISLHRAGWDSTCAIKVKPPLKPQLLPSQKYLNGTTGRRTLVTQTDGTVNQPLQSMIVYYGMQNVWQENPGTTVEEQADRHVLTNMRPCVHNDDKLSRTTICGMTPPETSFITCVASKAPWSPGRTGRNPSKCWKWKTTQIVITRWLVDVASRKVDLLRTACMQVSTTFAKLHICVPSGSGESGLFLRTGEWPHKLFQEWCGPPPAPQLSCEKHLLPEIWIWLANVEIQQDDGNTKCPHLKRCHKYK